jgi:hypothetical protein
MTAQERQAQLMLTTTRIAEIKQTKWLKRRTQQSASNVAS